MLRFGQEEVRQARPQLGSFKAYHYMRSNHQIPRFYAGLGPAGDVMWTSVEIAKNPNSEWSMFYMGTEEEFLIAVNEYLEDAFRNPEEHGFSRESLVDDIRTANAYALGGGEEL